MKLTSDGDSNNTTEENMRSPHVSEVRTEYRECKQCGKRAEGGFPK